MRIVTPHTIILGECPAPGIKTLEWIESAARTCYKSEERITENSAREMVKTLLNKEHLAMLEHSNVVFRVCTTTTNPRGLETSLRRIFRERTAYHKFYIHDGVLHISGNLRAWIESLTNPLGMLTDFSIIQELRYLIWENFSTLVPPVEPPPFKTFETVMNPEEIPMALKRITVKFICDRGVSHAIVRHRPCSFAQESTRFCNYSQEKFGNECSFIEPPGLSPKQRAHWLSLCMFAEEKYLAMLDEGCSPQIARSVLPNCTKTEIVVTADVDEWNIISKLRCSPAAHPQFRELMLPLNEALAKRFNGVLKITK